MPISRKIVFPALFGLAICLLAVELFARLLAMTSTLFGSALRYWQSRTQCMRRDIETGVLLLVPKSEFTELNPDGKLVRFRADAAGFRNDDDFHGQRILALGDSFTYGSGVDLSDRWPNLVGQQLGEKVYSLGAAHSGPSQQLVLLRRLLPAGVAGPKQVIVMVFAGNDLQDANAYLSVKTTAISTPAVEGVQQFYILPLEYLYSLRLGYVAARMLNRQRATGGRRMKVFDYDIDFFFARPDFSESPKYATGFREIEAAISALRDEVAARGGKLLVVYAPSKEEAYEGPLTRQHELDPKVIFSFDLELGVFCKTHDIDFLSLKPTLTQAANRGELMYFQRDGHWNRRGNRLAADAISRHLQAPAPSKLPLDP